MGEQGTPLRLSDLINTFTDYAYMASNIDWGTTMDMNAGLSRLQTWTKSSRRTRHHTCSKLPGYEESSVESVVISAMQECEVYTWADRISWHK